MFDFDLNAVIFSAPEHSQSLAEFFENFEPYSIQEEPQVEYETQVVETCCSLFSKSTPEPVALVGEYQLPFPPNPPPWASLIEIIGVFSHSTPQPVAQLGDFQLQFLPTPLPWVSEPLAPVPAASADPVPSNSASATQVSEPRLASSCREERFSKRQKNNIAVKKWRDKAKAEHRRNADKLSTTPAIVERIRCLLKRINLDADNFIVLNDLHECCDQAPAEKNGSASANETISLWRSVGKRPRWSTGETPRSCQRFRA